MTETENPNHSVPVGPFFFVSMTTLPLSVTQGEWARVYFAIAPIA